MKWSFEQKLAWAKSYMAGEFVPIPEGFSESMKGWHDKDTTVIATTTKDIASPTIQRILLICLALTIFFWLSDIN